VTDPRDDTTGAHRAFAIAAFNGAWELIDQETRTPDQDRQMLTLACTSRWHWSHVGTAEHLVVADWQVAHVASLIGYSTLALQFAQAAYDRARNEDLPVWLQASTAEGLARAHAAAGDRESYERYAAEARELLPQVGDDDRGLIESQLASIPPP